LEAVQALNNAVRTVMTNVIAVCEIKINDKLNVMLIDFNKNKIILTGENKGLRAAPTHTPLISTRRQVEVKRVFIITFQ
jgi:hypothetical protein